MTRGVRKRVRRLLVSCLVFALTAGVSVLTDTSRTGTEYTHGRETSDRPPHRPASTESEQTDERSVLPRSAPAIATFDSWTTASEADVADVLSDVGTPAGGHLSAYVDAPVTEGGVHAVRTTVPVESGRTYQFSVDVRQGSKRPKHVNAAFRVGATRFEIPDVDGAWSTVAGSYVVPPGVRAVNVSLVLDGPVKALGIDNVRLTDPDGKNVVFDPGFESVSADWGIASNSLIRPQRSPTVAVSLPHGDASWTLTNRNGEIVSSGVHHITHELEDIELSDVRQGYYEFSVTDSNGEQATAPVAIIDYHHAHITPDGRFGAASHLARPRSSDGADAARALGVGILRNDINWSAAERSRGAYHFSGTLARELEKVTSHGLETLAVLAYSNTLYSDGKRTPPSTAAGIEAFGRFGAEVAQSLDVSAVEVYNEFNSRNFNEGCRTPNCYLPLLESVDREISGVNSSVAVVAGATATWDRDWTADLWRVGAMAHADKISFHPYNLRSPERLAAAVSEANSDMRSLTGTTSPIWISEQGWTVGDELNAGVSRSEQANRLLRAEVTAIGSGVERYFWFNLIGGNNSERHEGNFGLYEDKRNYVAAHVPRPSAFVQALLINELGGRAFARRNNTDENVQSYQFGSVGDALRVAWTNDGDGTVSYATTEPVRVTGIWGETRVIRPKNGRVVVPIDESPVFIKQTNRG